MLSDAGAEAARPVRLLLGFGRISKPHGGRGGQRGSEVFTRHLLVRKEMWRPVRWTGAPRTMGAATGKGAAPGTEGANRAVTQVEPDGPHPEVNCKDSSLFRMVSPSAKSLLHLPDPTAAWTLRLRAILPRNPCSLLCTKHIRAGSAAGEEGGSREGR